MTYYKDITNDYGLVEDTKAVGQNVINILSHTPNIGRDYENRLIGVDLEQFLFHPMDASTMASIRQEIITRLPLFEPRIKTINVKINLDLAALKYVIDITITTFISLQQEQIQFILEKRR